MKCDVLVIILINRETITQTDKQNSHIMSICQQQKKYDSHNLTAPDPAPALTSTTTINTTVRHVTSRHVTSLYFTPQYGSSSSYRDASPVGNPHSIILGPRHCHCHAFGPYSSTHSPPVPPPVPSTHHCTRHCTSLPDCAGWNCGRVEL